MNKCLLVGEKIYLKPFEMNDIDEGYIQWINDHETTKFLDNPSSKTKEDLQNYAKNVLDDPNYVFFAVIEKKTNRHVGNAKIGPINWNHRRTTFGRLLSKETWGMGYGTEAVKLMVKYIFEELNLNRIVEHSVVDNIAAIRSVEKAGLDREGTIEEYVYSNGRYRDVTIMGLTRARYEEKKQNGLFK